MRAGLVTDCRQTRMLFSSCLLFRACAFHAAATLTILLLSACGPQLPPVSADTSCERFRHISATDAQIKVFSDNWEVMEPYADQIVSHNIEYDKQCIPKEAVK